MCACVYPCTCLWNLTQCTVSCPSLGSTEAGIVLFSGQACDAVGTLSVGLLSDKTTGCPSIGLGKRKSWYLPGLVLVAGG